MKHLLLLIACMTLTACSRNVADGVDIEIATKDCWHNGGVDKIETDHNYLRVWCSNKAYMLHYRHDPALVKH